MGGIQKVTPELEAEMKRLYLSGTLITHIAKEFGLGWYTVREHVKPEYKEQRLRHQRIREQRNFEARVNQTAKELTQWERGWISGLVDGEGTIYFGKTSKPSSRGFHLYLVKLKVSNTCRELLEKVCDVIGTGWIGKNVDKRNNRKTVYVFEVGSNVMRWLLPQLNLVVKKRQKELVLRALDLLREASCIVDASEQHKQLDDLRLEMTRLNHRGV